MKYLEMKRIPLRNFRILYTYLGNNLVILLILILIQLNFQLKSNYI